VWKGHRPKNLRPFLLSWTCCETTSTISHADLMRSNVSSGIRGISGGVGGLFDWCAGKLLPRTTACQTHHLWCLPGVPCTIYSISRHGGPSARGFGAPHHSGGWTTGLTCGISLGSFVPNTPIQPGARWIGTGGQRAPQDPDGDGTRDSRKI
jgi:hypothetical protein